MTKKKRKMKYVLRHMKGNYAYNLEEAAATINVHPKTLEMWIRKGVLKAIDKKHPILIHGTELQKCCSKKNEKRAHTCLPGESYCFHCKAPRMSKTDTAKLVQWAVSKYRIESECNDCGTKLCMTTSLTKSQKMLAEIESAHHRVKDTWRGSEPSCEIPSEAGGIKKTYNSNNERLKYNYCIYLVQAKGRSVKTLALVRQALLRYEKFHAYEAFSRFNKTRAMNFKDHLQTTESARGGNLSHYTILQTITFVRDFFHWLLAQPTYAKSIDPLAITYLTLEKNDVAAANAKMPKKYPTLQQAIDVLLNMPENTPREKRDKAIFAILMLTSVRDGALVTLRVKHLILEEKLLLQDPREVATKKGASITTIFIPVGKIAEDILTRYYNFLVKENGFLPDDPLFPKILPIHRKDTLYAPGASLSKEFLRDAQMPCRMVTKAFKERGYHGFSPHRLRDTAAFIGTELCENDLERKSWSKNFGHKDIRTTQNNYGHINHETQMATMRQIAERQKQPKKKQPELQDVLAMMAEIRDAMGIQGINKAPYSIEGNVVKLNMEGE